MGGWVRKGEKDRLALTKYHSYGDVKYSIGNTLSNTVITVYGDS